MTRNKEAVNLRLTQSGIAENIGALISLGCSTCLIKASEADI
jgi:hypothetical protein